MGNRIRILLLLLTLAFLGTALTIHFTIEDEDMLVLDTQKLSNSIHKKERAIENLLKDSITIKTFENVDKYPLQVSAISQRMAKQGILIYIYKDHKPVYWGSNIYVPLNDLGFKTNTSFIRTENRTFVISKKDLNHGVTIIALIPIKRSFNSNNEYLESIFSPKLLKTNNLDIANYSDTKNIKNIYSIDGNYLFSVKLKSGKKDNMYIDFQVSSWFLGLICIMLLTNSLSIKITHKGSPWKSIFFFGLLLIAYRYFDLRFNWLPMVSNSKLFDPKHYAHNNLLPNLWSFMMTSISLFWFICYVHSIRKHLKIPEFFTRKVPSIIISFLGLLSIYLFANMLYSHLGSLITGTSLINNDFTNILEIGGYSWFNILLFCVNITVLLLYIDFVVFISFLLVKEVNTALNIQLVALIVSMVTIAYYEEGIYFNILLATITLIRSFKRYKFKQVQLSAFIISVLLISLMSSIALTKSMRYKREETMKLILNSLESEDDVNAVSMFIDLEKNILNDNQLKHLFEISVPHTDVHVITQYIKNKYLSGYLSKFEFKGYYYYNQNKALDEYDENWIDYYREKIINSSTRIGSTESFYRLGSELGTHEYFAQISIPLSDDNEVQLYLDFKNKSYSTEIPYPELLTDSRLNLFQSESHSRSAFALYRDGQLITQNGDYTYPSTNESFPKDINKYIRMEDINGFFHMIYNPDSHTTLVMSKTVLSFWEFIAVFSFIFIILYIFFTLFNIINYIFGTINEKSYRYRNIKYHFLILRNTIRYSTRIQSLVIGSVILGIVFSGFIAFVSISRQLENNKNESKLKNISIITKKLENKLAENSNEQIANIRDNLLGMTDMSTMDFNLYDKSGELIFSSQPRIFELKLMSEFINPLAYEKLNVLKKSETIEKEQVGNFKFDATYATIRNSEYQIVAFLSFPNFSSKKEENMSNNLLLNTLLNIYTIIIILFGFFAVLVSNKITKPLSIIQKKLAQTTFSDKPNEPLYWERNDEIGTIVKEYNYMLVKLEESTKKLKNAERESAWREMAKQVAHEIKNPLTPMKLGIQQLNRSYDENDPRFSERFKKISNSFIEQIDSLSHIATEFSAFAKLPDTKLIKINILDKIMKSIHVYSNSPIASIKMINDTGRDEVFVYGDRDQLLRSFNNLIKNSVEAAIVKKKHRITITLNLENNGTNVMIQIKDNGTGIPKEIIPNIFQPNFTTKSSGTGLGLAFVKQTIDGMNGTITFDTKTNIGTNFIISIPVYDESMTT